MKNIFDVIADLDNAAKIPALRAVTHSSMAKAIGVIRQDIRDRARTQQRDEESNDNALDQRNNFDENQRSVEEISRAMGFGQQMPPLKQASILHAVYDWAMVQLNTVIISKWDAPLTLDGMLGFMTDKAQPLDETLVNALADAAKCDPKHIKLMNELQERQDREKLKEAIPEIKMVFNGFGENGYEDSIADLPVIAQHQLGVKVVDSLNKAKDQVLMRVMRSRRISDLASLPLIEDGVNQMTKWVNEFENVHAHEIGEAIEQGANIRTIDDVTQQAQA